MVDCPKFVCFRCREQGHYAKNGQAAVSKCKICMNKMSECICLSREDESDGENDKNKDKNVNNNDVNSENVNEEQDKSQPDSPISEEFENALSMVVSETVMTAIRAETGQSQPAASLSFHKVW